MNKFLQILFIVKAFFVIGCYSNYNYNNVDYSRIDIIGPENSSINSIIDIYSDSIDSKLDNVIGFSKGLYTKDDYSNTKFNSSFHLAFLIKLSKFLGFFPETENNHYKFFDLQHGCYTNTEDSKYLISHEELECFNMILGINFDDLNSLTINSVQRKNLLDNIILYYKLHIENFVSLKSLEVLRKLF